MTPADAAWAKSRAKCAKCANLQRTGPAWRCKAVRVNNPAKYAYCIDAADVDGKCGPTAILFVKA